jgi:hypothetical protein
MGEVVIRRGADTVGVFRRIVVRIDGVVALRLRVNQSKTLSLANGTHRVTARMDWVRSRELVIDVSDESTVILETAMPWRFLTWLFTTKPGGMDLTVVSTESR